VDWAAPRLLDWQREKAGTIEALHDVLKNELAAGVMPCGRLGANAAWFRLAVMTHNVLTALKRLALPEKWLTARPKRLRFQIFCSPGKLVSHARRMLLRVRRLKRTTGRSGLKRLRLLPLRTWTRSYLRTDYRTLSGSGWPEVCARRPLTSCAINADVRFCLCSALLVVRDRAERPTWSEMTARNRGPCRYRRITVRRGRQWTTSCLHQHLLR